MCPSLKQIAWFLYVVLIFQIHPVLYGTILAQHHQVQIDSLQKAIQQLTNQKDYQRLVKTGAALGHIYDSNGEYATAKLTYLRTLQTMDSVNDIHYTMIFNRITVSYWRLKNYDSALWYSKIAIKKARKYNQNEILADALVMGGLLHYQKGDFQIAIESYSRALSEYQNVGSTYNKASTILNIAIAYKKLALYDKAISKLFEAIALFEEISNSRSISSAYNSIADSYNEMAEYNRALDFNFKALEIRQFLHDSTLIASTLYNIGNVYKQIDSLNTALDYLQQSYRIKLRLGDTQRMGTTLQNIGEIYFKMKDLDVAERHYLEALQLAEQVEDKLTITNINNNLGELHLAKGDYKQARKHLDRARELAGEMQTLEVLRSNFELTSALYESLGRQDIALEYFKKQAVLRDSILNRDKQRALTEMQVKYETDQKEKDIANLNDKNSIQEQLLGQQQLSIYALVGTALLLLLLAFVIYNRYRLKNKANTHIKHLMNELNHRVKNNLQVISSLLKIQSSEVADDHARDVMLESRNRVSAMGLIHQRLYQKDGANSVDMQEYITDVIANLAESFGYTGKIKLDIDAHDLKLDVDTSIPLGLIINELSCNAFKYAFTKDSDNEFSISLKEKDFKLILLVKDNGPGIAESNGQDSFGLSLIESLTNELDGEITFKYELGTVIDLSIGRYKITDQKVHKLLKEI